MKILDKEVKVIFSSIKHPSDTIVQQSLLGLNKEISIRVITSKKFSKFWSNLDCKIQIAKFDSTATSRVILRKFLIRSSILRRILRFATQRVFQNSRQIMMPPHNARHFEYLKALKSLSPEEWVILVDSRDLIFQSSPQEIIHNLDSEVPIHLFLEDGNFFKTGSEQLNDTSPANWNWARQILNFDSTRSDILIGTRIVNSGCIIGRVRELTSFFEESCNLLTASLYSSYALLDQASVNVIAYSFNDKFKMALHKNGEVVLNMCGVVDEMAEIRNGQIFLDGVRVPIVHQFDRFGTWTDKHGLAFSKRDYRVQ